MYVPYIHVRTGERAMVPLRVDDTTGARTPIAPPPVGFIPSTAEFSSGPPSFLKWLAGLLCRHTDEPAVGSYAVPAVAPIPPTRHRLSPTNIRQLDFSDEADDGAIESSSARLTSTTLKTLMSKLDLPDIADYIVDLKAACGRRDLDAHLLLVSPDWRAVLAGGRPAMIDANKRIAEYVTASIDNKSDNVKRLMSNLRQADSTDRPGVLFSGMDILEEIAALVTERSLGEIKLNSITESTVFAAGAHINETRIAAISIKKNFALKTDAERAAPNALFHEIITKMPNPDNSTLKLKKEDYEDKLYKAEMHGESPPWTVDQLIDSIAVDLARASPIMKVPELKEIAAADRFPPPVLQSYTKCASCGAVGKHLARDCPVKCSKCNFNFCPGNRGQVCAVECSEQPSTRSLKNFMGNPLFHTLVTKLDEAWSKKHGKKIEVSAAEILVVEGDEEDDVPGCDGLVNPGNTD